LSRSATVVHLHPRIVFDVEAELADYLLGEFARHWPAVRLHAATGRTGLADLLVVDREPATRPTLPTLWLAGIDGSRALTQLAPGYWRVAMPTTPLRLQRILESCLAHRAADGGGLP
jgi:hypothetical protein